MLEDLDEPTIFLGLAGAIIPAGMKKVISTMVKRKMVDVIVTTGANAYHDLVESFGHHHYKGSPEVDDAELYQRGIDRIYDTFADEEKYRLVDRKIMALADRIRTENADAASMSSREFLHELGGLIDRDGLKGEKESSFVWNCWRNKVPVFVPALCDSSIGLALTGHYINSIEKALKPLAIDQIRDNYEIFEIKKSSKKTGVIFTGGGVPKNYIQQTSYLEETFGARNNKISNGSFQGAHRQLRLRRSSASLHGVKPKKEPKDGSPLRVKIQNVVASAAFNQNFDLNAIANAFPWDTEFKKRFPGLVFRLKEPKTAMLIFNSGKMICAGGKAEDEARRAILTVVRKLKKGGINVTGEPENRITNIVASATLDGVIDLDRLYSERGGGRIIFEPEQFPALIYRWKNPEMVFLIFSTGKIVCVGAKKEKEIYEAVENLRRRLEDSEVLIRS